MQTTHRTSGVVGHPQPKRPFSILHFRACFRSFQSHRSPQGEASLIKRKKTTFFFPQLLLSFLSISTNIHGFHGREGETEARRLRPSVERGAAAPEHHSRQFHPSPGNLDSISGFGRVLGPGCAPVSSSGDFPAPWFTFQPSGAASAGVGHLGTSEGREQWDIGRGAASAFQN